MKTILLVMLLLGDELHPVALKTFDSAAACEVQRAEAAAFVRERAPVGTSYIVHCAPINTVGIGV